jgi:hypothetical protein
MDFRELDLNLIPKALAQTLDANAQPTFGLLNLGNNTGATASVTLTASSTTVGVGGTVDVDVSISTGAFTINEYHIVIDFTTTKLQVVDAEPSITGTQIKFLDTVFTTQNGSNTVSPTGRITLIAKTPTGNALQVNRKVATIKFQAQSTGTTIVQSVTGASGMQLINENGVAIASSTNNVTLAINTQSQSSASIPGSTSSQSTTTVTSSSPSSRGGGTIPDTGLAEDLSAFLPVLIGAVLIVLGVTLRRQRPNKK